MAKTNFKKGIAGIGDTIYQGVEHKIVYVTDDKITRGNHFVQLAQELQDQESKPVVYKKSKMKFLFNAINPRFGDKIRPLQAGYSIGKMPNGLLGSFTTGAGTIGGFPKDNISGKRILLTNNHVAAMDMGYIHNAIKGDLIIQPGFGDKPSIPDKIFEPIKADVIIGKLDRWSSIKHKDTGIINKVDGAIVEIDDQIELDLKNACGCYTGPSIDPVVGMVVKKAGRSTGCRTGTIEAINVEFEMPAPGKNWCDNDNIVMMGDLFTITGNLGQPGDSGSLIVKADTGEVVGLLFAGEEDAAAACRIKNVESELGVTFEGSNGSCTSIDDPVDPLPPFPDSCFIQRTVFAVIIGTILVIALTYYYSPIGAIIEVILIVALIYYLLNSKGLI